MRMIKISNVSKTYPGGVRALNNISLQIEDAELYGCIGPDGAGKSTLFRMIVSLLIPDAGTIEVNGLDIVSNYKQIRSKVGYMPGRFSLYPDLSVKENINFFASIFNTTFEKNYHIIKDIYDQLSPFSDRPAGKLSGGMKQKLALCCALIHNPEVLILDEPTTGVDAVSRIEFWQILAGLKASGMTIVVSTPYMDEATLCDRVSLIQGGEILTSGTPVQITEAFPAALFSVRTRHSMYSLVEVLRQMPEISSAFLFGQAIHVVSKDMTLTSEMLQAMLNQSQYEEIGVSKITPTIEDCFMYLTDQTNISHG
ncbi:MAG: ABC transporter ATP-binding protein [Sphingobacteriia bacterium]|nr:ABC transporter ATP-binding protein [Sphingobacteriia bacterium]